MKMIKYKMTAFKTTEQYNQTPSKVLLINVTELSKVIPDQIQNDSF